MGSSRRALAWSAAPALARAGLALPSPGTGCHGDSPRESRAFLVLSGAGARTEPAHRRRKGGHFLRAGLRWQIKSLFMQGECRDVHSALSVQLGAAARTIWGAGKTALPSPLFTAVTSKREDRALPSLTQLPSAETLMRPIPSHQP